MMGPVTAMADPVAVTERATLVLAPNPGPMTLEGTNTWILREPGSTVAVVLDPGPDDPAHLARVAEVATRDGGTVSGILLTHSHPDHAAGAPAFSALVGAPVLTPPLGASTVAGFELLVLQTPGHSSDSMTFSLVAEGSLLTGDTVLGRGTTVVAHPDGLLGDYLLSLERLRAIAGAGELARILPGHGPVLTEPIAVLDYYLTHRRERLAQVEAALALGHTEPGAVVRHVYADVDPVLWPAAELSVRAQLYYLRAHGIGC